MSYGLTQSLDLELSSSQYASISDASQTGLDITGNLTCEAWINLESSPSTGGRYTIASKSKISGSQRGWRFAYHNNGGTLRLEFANSDNGVGENAQGVAQTLSTSTWYHVAVVYTAADSSAEFFVDGSSIGTASSLDSSIFSNSAPFMIGSVNEGGNDFFDGKISLVRVWDTTRSGANIAANKCSVLGSTSNLKGEWTLDNVYTDNSGNSNTLTSSGSPSFVSDVPATCSVTTGIKTFDGLAYASTKSVDGLAIASVKTFNGLA